MIFSNRARASAQSMNSAIQPTYQNLPQTRMLIILLLTFSMGSLLVLIKPEIQLAPETVEVETAPLLANPASLEQAEDLTAPGLAPFFTPEVQNWSDDILRWAAAYEIDPNIVATIMQVESCGDPMAVSSAGALGLFQVMPFHFTAGEDGLDPEINSQRGIRYFLDRMEQTAGNVGLSFAGYNGGHVAAGTTWENWAAETQRYYVWTTGIYQDVTAGQNQSETLQRWLQAGGASLCRQAAQRLGL